MFTYTSCAYRKPHVEMNSFQIYDLNGNLYMASLTKNSKVWEN